MIFSGKVQINKKNSTGVFQIIAHNFLTSRLYFHEWYSGQITRTNRAIHIGYKETWHF